MPGLNTCRRRHVCHFMVLRSYILVAMLLLTYEPRQGLSNSFVKNFHPLIAMQQVSLVHGPFFPLEIWDGDKNFLRKNLRSQNKSIVRRRKIGVPCQNVWVMSVGRWIEHIVGHMLSSIIEGVAETMGRCILFREDPSMLCIPAMSCVLLETLSNVSAICVSASVSILIVATHRWWQCHQLYCKFNRLHRNWLTVSFSFYK